MVGKSSTARPLVRYFFSLWMDCWEKGPGRWLDPPGCRTGRTDAYSCTLDYWHLRTLTQRLSQQSLVSVDPRSGGVSGASGPQWGFTEEIRRTRAQADGPDSLVAERRTDAARRLPVVGSGASRLSSRPPLRLQRASAGVFSSMPALPNGGWAVSCAAVWSSRLGKRVAPGSGERKEDLNGEKERVVRSSHGRCSGPGRCRPGL